MLRCGTFKKPAYWNSCPFAGIAPGTFSGETLMTATAQTLRPPSRTLMFLEGRAIHELGARRFHVGYDEVEKRCSA